SVAVIGGAVCHAVSETKDVLTDARLGRGSHNKEDRKKGQWDEVFHALHEIRRWISVNRQLEIP
ncbi:MAG: hypothetical protein EBY43_02980, partial [Opitutae bacterium]|nr:hypothetical protein [Opitutae bacterium]